MREPTIDERDAVEAIARFELGDAGVGSVCAAYADRDGVEWVKAWGVASQADGTPTSATVYRAASVTKMFTALAFLQLADRDRLRLSDPLSLYVPEIASTRSRNERSQITLAQLATMTGGLPPEVPGAGVRREAPPREFEKATLAAIPRIELIAEPGTRFGYSNLSYALLGLACARAAGVPYHVYVQREILDALGMAHSGFGPTLGTLTSLATGHDLTGGAPDTATPEREHRGRGYALPAGGLYSTAHDLALFGRFLIAGDDRVLSTGALDAAYDGLVAADRDLNFGEGLGFAAIRDLRSHRVAQGHFGIVSGYKCGLVFSRESDRALVVCTSVTRTEDTADLARAMIEIVAT